MWSATIVSHNLSNPTPETITARYASEHGILRLAMPSLSLTMNDIDGTDGFDELCFIYVAD